MTNSNNEILNFGLAVQRDKEVTDFINISAFGKTAQLINKYCKKGDKLLIEGNLRQQNYTDKDGKNRSVTSVNVDKVEFISAKKEEPKKNDGWESAKNIEIKDDDLPFGKAY